MPPPAEVIRVRGARTHNLQGLNLDLPRGRLTVFTGVSGSGKSSLAFDTIHAEGRRRYLETLPGDARALFDQLQRPEVDSIEGLPPTLCVSQQTAGARPRSTLATVTEIHDHLRLLYARLGTPHCPDCGIPVYRHTLADVVRATLAQEEGRKLYVLAPLVLDQPGAHKEVFQQIRQGGFLRARVDGVLMEIRDTPKLGPKAQHTIEMVVDRLVLRPTIAERLHESLQTAVKHSGGRVIITDIDTGDWRDFPYSTRLECPRCGRVIPDPEPRRFSFNTPEGACPRCAGLGQVWEFDPAQVVPDRRWPLTRVLDRLGELLPEGTELPALDRKFVKPFQAVFGKAVAAQSPLANWPEVAYQALLHGTERTDPPFAGLLAQLRDAARRLTDADDGVESLLALTGYVTCPECGGARLNREARAVRFEGKGLHEITALSVDDAAAFFAGLTGRDPKEKAEDRVRTTLLAEIGQRLRFLQEVGLGYLTLDRPAPTLSGGEAQRARLATQLGGGLLGVCYILDEPTMGLHPRDTDRLIGALRGLQRHGNTVLVVEHDEAVIRQADYLVDIGPGAGKDGGRLLAAGTLAEVLANPGSVTAPYLRHETPQVPAAEDGVPTPPHRITIKGARHHNLRNIDMAFPLGRWTCLTGVSGSGKSSLARDVLCYAARRHLGLLAPPPGAHDAIDGLEHLDKVIEVDQKPLGRSARSTPATYTGVFDEVRKVFAATRLAKARGYKANRFSFNVRGGRCEECQGQGSLRVALQFLPDLGIPCPSCGGRRFNPATLEVLYRGRSIADVLAMPVAEAAEFFANVPAVRRGLEVLRDVGLGYLPLGQPAATLSGGEAQRVKLAAELARPQTGRTLFLLDEPTTGLHFADVATLVRVLRRLTTAGNTLVVIEHHPDLIAAADWVIDLGPGGGPAGGRVLAAGTPRAVAAAPGSITGPYLRV
jgi:excinuclease ABC subunit A